MMRMKWIATTVAALLLLGACTTPNGGDIDVSTPEKVQELDCTAASVAKSRLDDVTAGSVSPGQRNSVLRDLHLADETDAAIAATQDALNDKLQSAECISTPSPAPSESEQPKLDSSPTATESPTETDGDIDASTFENWQQVVDNPPAGLKDAINTHADEIGFTWDDVEADSKVRVDVDGKQEPAGARVILVAGNSLSDEDARNRAGYNPDAKIPVVHVKSCSTVQGANGCPSGKSVRVILTPIRKEDGRYVMTPGSGVAPSEGFAIVTYTWHSL